MKNSIAVEVPKEITDYKPKVMMGFTGRQLVSVLWVGIVVIPLYVVSVIFLNFEGHLLNLLTMTLAVPPLGWGFIRKNGLPFEKLIKIKREALRNRKRRVFATDRNDQTMPKTKRNKAVKRAKTVRKSKKMKKYNEGAEYEFETNEKAIKKQAKIGLKQVKRAERFAKKYARKTNQAKG